MTFGKCITVQLTLRLVLVFARMKGMYLLSAKTVKKKSLNIIHRYSAPDILKFQRLTISAINSLPALIDLFHYMHKIPYIIIF